MSIMVMPAFLSNILPDLIVRFSFFNMSHIHINDTHSLSCTILRLIPQSSNKGQSDPGKPRIMPTRRLRVRRWSRNAFLRLRTTCFGTSRDSWPTCINKYDSARVLIRPGRYRCLEKHGFSPWIHAQPIRGAIRQSPEGRYDNRRCPRSDQFPKCLRE